VPFVAAGPGIAPRATPDATPVVGTDLYPTLLAIARVQSPADPASDRACDGVDISGVLAGNGSIAERALLFHQPHKWGPEGPGIEPFTAIRRGDWKLIWFHDDLGSGVPRVELYDVAHDVGESSNRAAELPGKRAELEADLREAFAACGAQPSKVRATGAEATPDFRRP
jgi:arylsulfatase A-like enzyme